MSGAIKSFPGAAQRIERRVVDGDPIWVKDFDQESPSKWHGVQKALLLVTRLPLVAPVPSHAGRRGADAEINAIRRFRAAGAYVPDIVWAEGARVALSDIGETLRDLERRKGERAIRVPAAVAARELGQLHGQSLVHGRPILRNLTWTDRRIGFLDFEEQPLEVMPIEAAQARDILLFLMSIGRRGDPALLSDLASILAKAMTPAAATELRRVLRLGRPLTGPLGRVLTRSGNRDVIGLTRALTALRIAMEHE